MAAGNSSERDLRNPACPIAFARFGAGGRQGEKSPTATNQSSPRHLVFTAVLGACVSIDQSRVRGRVGDGPRNPLCLDKHLPLTSAADWVRLIRYPATRRLFVGIVVRHCRLPSPGLGVRPLTL